MPVRVAVMIVISFVGCELPARHVPAPPDDGRVSVTYAILDQPIANPERGLVQYVDITDPNDIAFVSGLGVTLANARIHLDAYRFRPIDPAFITSLERGFDRIRRAGLKLILRFQYNNGSGADPPLAIVIAHLDQLAPILERHADVIAVMQAGFIGAWGEWHNSISRLTRREASAAILDKLLAVLPRSRSIQVRSPRFKAAILGDPIESRSTSKRGRVGHHNDCLLASRDDRGTYPEPIERYRAYLRVDGRNVPVGGETCGLNPPRTDCDSAVRELRRLHWSYLNRSYHPAVIATWKRQGCMRDIARDLGYRLVLRRASWPREVVAGEPVEIDIEIENLGFAAPFNPRSVFLVVGDRSVELTGVDPRRWYPGARHVVRARFAVPALEPGDHALALWLPDPAPMLRPWPAYSVRLANRDVWRPEAGDNRLGALRVVTGHTSRALALSGAIGRAPARR